MEISKRAGSIAPSLTLKITAMANELKAQGKSVVGFGAGEPDFPTPKFICDAAIEAIQKGMTRYTPAAGTKQLREEIAKSLKAKYGLDYAFENIVVSNGAKHSLFNACQAILNEGDECIIPSPFWLTYPELVKMAQGVPVFVQGAEENGFKPTIEQFKAAITEKTKAIILNSPSNPCGGVYSKEELEAIAEMAIEKDIYIISDEIYAELVYEGEKHISIATLGEEIKERTIVVNGMSKAYAMTGWRIGYTASNLKLAKAMGSYQSHATSNPNSIAQAASVAALKGEQSFIEEMRLVFDKRRQVMCELINEIDGISAIPPKGAFYVMMNIKNIIGKSFNGKVIEGSASFAEMLLESELCAVVPGIAFGTDEFVRLSYAISEADIREGIKRIASFIGKVK